MSDGVHPAVQEWTTNSSIERLRTLLASVDLDQLTPTIEPLVMNTERGRTWTALFNAQMEEMQENAPAAAAPVPAATAATTETTAPDVVATGSASEESMEVEEEPATATAPPASTKKSRLERLRQEAAARKETKTEPEPVIDVVMGSQSWHNEVPRVSFSGFFSVFAGQSFFLLFLEQNTRIGFR